MGAMNPPPDNSGIGLIQITDLGFRKAAQIAVLAMLALACTAGGDQPGTSAASLPPEAADLRLVVDEIVPPSSVTETEAIQIANAESGFNKDATKVEAWLRQVTDPSSPMLLTDRAVWLVHYAGVSIETPSVPRADGGVKPGRLMTNAFVFIDANTGEFIANTFTP